MTTASTKSITKIPASRRISKPNSYATGKASLRQVGSRQPISGYDNMKSVQPLG